jgi:hypothetical protein
MVVEECQEEEEFGPAVQPLFCVCCFMRNQTRKQPEMDNILQKSQPTDVPITSGEVLPSASVAINAVIDIADFFNQFSLLLLQSPTSSLFSAIFTYNSVTHPLSKPSN